MLQMYVSKVISLYRFGSNKRNEGKYLLESKRNFHNDRLKDLLFRVDVLYITLNFHLVMIFV